MNRFFLFLATFAALCYFCSAQEEAIGDGCVRTFGDGWRYNLSSLMRNDPWTLGTSPKLFLNVCGNIVQQPSACTAHATAPAFAVFDTECIALGGGEGGGMGGVRFLRLPGGQEDLNLIYTNGDPCGVGRRRNLRIAFRCGEGEERGPALAMQEPDGCTVSVLWETKAACPKKVSMLALCLNDVRTFCHSTSVSAALEVRCLRSNLNKLSADCTSSLPATLLSCVPDAVAFCGSHGGPEAVSCLAENGEKLGKKCLADLRTFSSHFMPELEAELMLIPEEGGDADEEGEDGSEGEEEPQRDIEGKTTSSTTTETNPSESTKKYRTITIDDDIVAIVSIVFGCLFATFVVFFSVRRCFRSRCCSKRRKRSKRYRKEKRMRKRRGSNYRRLEHNDEDEEMDDDSSRRRRRRRGSSTSSSSSNSSDDSSLESGGEENDIPSGIPLQQMEEGTAFVYGIPLELRSRGGGTPSAAAAATTTTAARFAPQQQQTIVDEASRPSNDDTSAQKDESQSAPPPPPPPSSSEPSVETSQNTLPPAEVTEQK